MMVRTEDNHYQSAVKVYSRRCSLVWKSVVVGAVAGLVTTLYRLLLMQTEETSKAVYRFFANHMAFAPLLFIGLGLLGYLIGMLVKRYKAISGSGIPQVKGILLGSYQAPWLSTLLAKFFGGAATILAGLSLGREGPSIQLGGCAADGMAKVLAKSRTEKRILIASGASAGLAAAFNAPLAGAMFAMEEVFKYISPLVLLSTVASAVTADFVSKLVFGMAPVFSFSTPLPIPLSGYWLLLLLGIVLGVAGSLYNTILTGTIALYKRPAWLKPAYRPIIPFVLAGVLAFLFPSALGGGHAILDSLKLSTPIYSLLLILAVKFLFSMISFAPVRRVASFSRC